MEPHAVYTLAFPPLKLIRPGDPVASAVNEGEDIVDSSVKKEEGIIVAAREEQDTTKLIQIGIDDAFEAEFKALRASCNIDETSFFKSLQNMDLTWSAKGGKSGASFSRTQDQKFILKQISEKEFRCFLKNIGPTYFNYLKTTDHTCLAKIFRVYEEKHGLKNKFMIVMENLKFGKDIAVTYDLKGKIDRNMPHSDDVKFEEDFITDALCITQVDKKALQDAVYRDANFLMNLNIMDYSLLVGVDKEKQEIVCGMIDFLVPYTAAKKLERFAKVTILTCICANVEPTVLPPIPYRNRLTRFVENEFKVQPS